MFVYLLETGHCSAAKISPSAIWTTEVRKTGWPRPKRPLCVGGGNFKHCQSEPSENNARLTSYPRTRHLTLKRHAACTEVTRTRALLRVHTRATPPPSGPSGLRNAVSDGIRQGRAECDARDGRALFSNTFTRCAPGVHRFRFNRPVSPATATVYRVTGGGGEHSARCRIGVGHKPRERLPAEGRLRIVRTGRRYGNVRHKDLQEQGKGLFARPPVSQRLIVRRLRYFVHCKHL